jgi:5-methylcytosine-specific restriction endonuclease McrA
MTKKTKSEAGRLGGLAWSTTAIKQKAERILQYNNTPKLCTQCHSAIPYEGHSRKSFCSLTCSAIYNNTGRIKVYKPLCKHCGLTINVTKGKFCSTKCSGDSRRKYKNLDEATEIARVRRNESSANYRAKLKNQTPINADRDSIKEFYSNCPEEYEVDHIIPISKGGEHTISNLQYLTITENRKKSNKLLVGPVGIEPTLKKL